MSGEPIGSPFLNRYLFPPKNTKALFLLAVSLRIEPEQREIAPWR